MKLIARDFLIDLSEEEGAQEMLNDLMVEQGMSFHDAVVKIAKHHGLTVKYINTRDEDGKAD